MIDKKYESLKKLTLDSKKQCLESQDMGCYRFYIDHVTDDYLITLKEKYNLQKKISKIQELKIEIEKSIKRKDGGELNAQGFSNELEKILKE